jgi:DNA-binding NarL/FixJ family response regulator
MKGVLNRPEERGTRVRERSATVESAKVLVPQVGLLQGAVPNPGGVSLVPFTDREIKVLELLADGLDTVEVGRRLFYSERTVKNIIYGVTSRLNLRNRTQAVVYAVRQGWV